MGISVRAERLEDRAVITSILEAAFETPAEANLVNALRQSARPFISLVAEQEREIVGHILFTPVTLEGHESLNLLGLAPMAVLPAFQRQSIGSMLVYAGLEACREAGAGGVVVLGHPTYYPRFGFVPSVQFGFRSTYPVPDEVFMALELTAGYLADVSGVIRYHPAFDQVS